MKKYYIQSRRKEYAAYNKKERRLIGLVGTAL
jgi:hypothetical protein